VWLAPSQQTSLTAGHSTPASAVTAATQRVIRACVAMGQASATAADQQKVDELRAK
jgi:hypothetical protein